MSISSSATGLRPGVVTSTTRPTTPYLGQLIFQTDTGTMHNWDGAAWQFLAPTQQRNVLYNGAMQVAQRGTSTTSITAAGYYTADRWRTDIATMGTWTSSVENDAPTGSGFRKSLKALCTTADASPAAGDVCAIQQLLEGQDLQAFRKGTSSAQQFTISFWVKSNVTGTYIFELYDVDNTRQVSKSYTVSSSGTWEFKTLTLPADTTGAFDNDNGLSLYVIWWLGGGSTFTSGTLNTSWATVTNANRAVGQVNVAAATNNYFQVTGVQLNVGGVAAPFEFKSFERDLQECQRYYEKSYNVTTAPATATTEGLQACGSMLDGASQWFANVYFKVEKRTHLYTVSFYNEDGTAGWKFSRSGATTTATPSYIWPSTSGFSPYYVWSGATWVVALGYGHYIANAEF